MNYSLGLQIPFFCPSRYIYLAPYESINCIENPNNMRPIILDTFRFCDYKVPCTYSSPCQLLVLRANIYIYIYIRRVVRCPVQPRACHWSCVLWRNFSVVKRWSVRAGQLAAGGVASVWRSWVWSPPGPRQCIGSFVGLYAFPCARASKLN